MSLTTTSVSPSCITACSLMNQSTCEYISPSRLVVREEDIQAELYQPDGCYNTTLFRASQDYHLFEQFSLHVSHLMMCVGMLGLCGNILSICVLTRREMRNCFNTILIAINISDSLHLICGILEVMRNSYQEYYPTYLLLIFPYLHYPLYRITLVSSIYLMLSVAMERYTAVCRPVHYRDVQGDSGRPALYILPSLVFALLLNCTRFFETEVVSNCYDLSHCGPCMNNTVWIYYVKPTQLRLDKTFIIFYQTWTWVLFTGIIPQLVLVYLNIRILVALRKLRQRLRTSQQSKDDNLAFILISTVIMFFFCHLPRYQDIINN